ncbi:hypothetical protein Cni_G13471 [Canna indica]|uniref:Uncharacterized protein n=1 Tax=Canna indica TaxID=4628 RepID=A0AAQ3K9Y5_9LILI|nr:hypothetical protein Cni_G13471 [Canna indica]
MSSGCKSSLGCVDARVPVRATYVNLYKWPESDAEFVKSVTSRRGGRADGSDANLDGRRKWSAATGPAVVDSFSCRQIYLRSYTFSRKETVPEKTMRCLGRVKERAAVFPFLQQRNNDQEDNASSVNGDSSSKKNFTKRSKTQTKTNTNKKRKKKKKKACVTARKIREISYSTLCFIFHRLLSCTASVDVVDREQK